MAAPRKLQKSIVLHHGTTTDKLTPESASSHPDAHGPPKIAKKGTNPRVKKLKPSVPVPTEFETPVHGTSDAAIIASYNKARLRRHPELAAGAPSEPPPKKPKTPPSKKPKAPASHTTKPRVKKFITAKSAGIYAKAKIVVLAEWNTNTTGAIVREASKKKREDWESRVRRKYFFTGAPLVPLKHHVRPAIIPVRQKYPSSVHIVTFGEKKEIKERDFTSRNILPRVGPIAAQGYSVIHKFDKYGRYFTVPMGRELGPGGVKYVHTEKYPQMYKRERGNNVMTTSQALSFLGTIEHAFTKNPVFGGLPFVAKTWPSEGMVGTMGGKNVRGVEQPAADIWEELKDDIRDIVVKSILGKELGLKDSQDWISRKQKMLDKGEPFIPTQLEEMIGGVSESRTVKWYLTKATRLKMAEKGPRAGHYRTQAYGPILPMTIHGEEKVRSSDTPLVWLGDLLNSIECWGTWETRELFYGVKTTALHSAVGTRWRLEEGKGVVRRDKRVTMVDVAKWMSKWAFRQGGFLSNPVIVEKIKKTIHDKVSHFIATTAKGYRQIYMYEVTQAGKRKG